MKYILIIMAITYSYSFEAVHTEHIEFENKYYCEEALKSINDIDFGRDNFKAPKAVCVAKGEE